MTKPPATELDAHIGLRLKQLRQKHKISAEKLAEALGTTQQQISRYENATNKISASQLFALAQSLKVPLSWFFQGYESPNYPAMYEESHTYETERAREELEMITSRWFELTSSERETMLKLLNTFLLKSRN